MAVTTLVEAFQRTAAADPNRVALRTVDRSVELTWADYGRRVRSIAEGLVSLGVDRGDTVAIMLTNRPEFHLLDIATLHAGATPFSIYNTLAPEQIASVCVNAGARVVVTERRFLPQIRAAQPDTKLEQIVLVDGDVADTIPLKAVELQLSPGFDFDRRWQSVMPDDLLTIVFTSGTTGPPKGVEITHRSLLTLLDSYLGALDRPNGWAERMLSFLPAAHMAERFGLHYLQLAEGSTITTCPDVAQVIRALPQVRPTYFGAVPRIWVKLMEGVETQLATASPMKRVMVGQAIELSKRRVRARRNGIDVGRPTRLLLEAADRVVFTELRKRLGLDECRWAIVGSVSTPPEVLEFFAALGIPLSEMYGMTETSGFITVNPADGRRIGSVGKAVPGVTLRLAADGELLIAGPVLMRGYRNEPDKTAEAIDGEGWLHTGDIAEIDEDGFMRIVDRKKELIINAAGKNMSPLNIEAAIKTASPLIAHAVAIGDGRPYNVALIVPNPEAQHHGDLRAQVSKAVRHANSRLARVEQIKRFAVIDGDWRPGGDEITPKGTLKRKPIAAKYAAEIEALYAAEGAGT